MHSGVGLLKILNSSLSTRVIYWNVLASALLFGAVSQAAMTQTLPAGINSPMFKFGQVTEVGQSYDTNGKLWKTGDLKSVQFDAKTLSQIAPKAKTLIDVLNTIGHEKYGDSLSFGVLKLDLQPEVKYFAPVFARGITQNWTLALAVPTVTYTNNVKVTNVLSNAEVYKQQFGGISEDLATALNTDIKAEAMNAIESKGYKPISSREEKFVHDLQLVSLYKLYEQGPSTIVHTAYLQLPTGPKYDPDDLLALNMSGQTSLENVVSYAYTTNLGIKLIPSVAYLHYLPDQIVKRVPVNEDDVLPDESSKETVTRQSGSRWTYKAEAEYLYKDKFKFTAGYAITDRANDGYSGSHRSRYDLLEKDTWAKEQIASVGIAYDAVNSYFKKQSLIPFIISYDISDVIRGQNTVRKLIQEINFIMFF